MPANATMQADTSSAVRTVDVARLRRNVGGDSSMVADLLQVFEETWEGTRSEIAAAVELQDSAHLGRVVHCLRGSLAVLAARCVSIAERIELEADRGLFQSAILLLPALEAEIARLIQELHKFVKEGAL